MVVTVTMNVSPINTGLPSAFDGLFVQGKSKLHVTFAYSEPVRVIDHYRDYGKFEGIVYTPTFDYTVDDKISGGSFDTDYIGGENIFATGYAVPFVESSAYLIVTPYTIPETHFLIVKAIPYNTPSVIAPSGADTVICTRCQQDGTHDAAGTYLHIKCARKYAKALHGTSPYDSQPEQLNFCSIRYRHKASTLQTWSAWTELLSASDLTTDSVDTVLSGIVPSTTQSYDIEISAVDTLGGEGVYSTKVPTGNANFHLRAGGSGAAFGKFAEHDDMLEIDYTDTQINHDLTVSGTITGALTGNVTGNVNGSAKYVAPLLFSNITTDALNCENGITPFYTSASTTGLESSMDGEYTLGYVIKRDANNLLVVAYDLSDDPIETFFKKYYRGAWYSWYS